MSDPLPDRRPTIRDVALLAGVSKSLVSLVYSNPDAVSAGRAQRVLTAAAELGFRPNHVARALNGPRDDFVGILVSDLHNPVFAEVVDAARATLGKSGRLGLITSAMLPSDHADGRLDTESIAMLADLRPSGVLVVGSVPDAAQLAVALNRIPRIVVASARLEELPSMATVRGDDDAGMRLLVEHLLDLGHRRIGHVGGAGGLVAADRATSFQAVMSENLLFEPALVVESDYSADGGRRAASALLDLSDPPTAITAVNDLAAVGVLTAVHERGLTGVVSVTGYDNSFLAGLEPISLTSIDPGNLQIGHRAAELLLHSEPGPGDALIRPSLVIRGSTVPVRH